MELTDEQWQLVEPLLALPVRTGRGRPVQDVRAVLNGIFWKVRTGSRWEDLPSHYPSSPTCRRYLHAWKESGALNQVLRTLVQDMAQRGGFSIRSAIQQGDILLDATAGKVSARFAPHWQNTWQAATASILLQLVIARASLTFKSGRPVPASIWDQL